MTFRAPVEEEARISFPGEVVQMSVRGTPMSYEEYTRLPDDGRTAYMGGMVVMVPTPRWGHQSASKRIARLLDDAAPPGLEAIEAWGWRLAPDYEPAPDLMLVPPAPRGSARFTGAPALAVEILSSKPAADLVEKSIVYARAGLPYYWVVDLAEPSVRALELRDGLFVEVAAATVGAPADLPFRGGSARVDVDAL